MVQYIFVCLWQVLVEREDTKEGGKQIRSDDFLNLISKHLPSSDLKSIGRNDEMRLARSSLMLLQSFTHSLLLLTETMEKQID